MNLQNIGKWQCDFLDIEQTLMLVVVESPVVKLLPRKRFKAGAKQMLQTNLEGKVARDTKNHQFYKKNCTLNHCVNCTE